MKKERDWEEYRGIIFGLAFKFSPDFQEMEDYVGEGFVCFMEVVREEERFGLLCPFEAALSTRIKQHFLNLIEKKKAKKRSAFLITLEEAAPYLGKNPWKKIETYISLNKEMREVVDVILGAPTEFVDLIRREDFKTGLSKYLKKHKGWTPKRVNKFWEDFKIKEEE
jgi:hypothetical protein